MSASDISAMSIHLLFNTTPLMAELCHWRKVKNGTLRFVSLFFGGGSGPCGIVVQDVEKEM